MLKQAELFAVANQIPPTGLATEKTQALDLLEGLRRKEEAKEEAQGILWEGNMHNFPWKKFVGINYKMYKGNGGEMVYVKRT